MPYKGLGKVDMFQLADYYKAFYVTNENVLGRAGEFISLLSYLCPLFFHQVINCIFQTVAPTSELLIFYL